MIEHAARGDNGDPGPGSAIPDATDLDATAARFAAMPADQAESLIELYAAQAVAQWRVSDATFWQRVKFRARLLRALARGRTGAIGTL